MAVSKKDYELIEVTAAKSVLIEIMHLLGAYRDDVILVGGWVPDLLFPNSLIPHVGSNDVDILLNHNNITNSGYKTIKILLTNRGYTQSSAQPYIFLKNVEIPGGKFITIQVDFLAGEYLGTSKSRRTQRVQDMQPRKVRGGELAFLNTHSIDLKGKLPNGVVDQVNFKVVALPVFIVMKGIAMKDRLKEKDAWDIYYCLLQFGENLQTLADQLKPLMGNTIAKEAIDYIIVAFEDINGIGPSMIADFEEAEGEERQFIKRDSFERVNMMIRLIS